MRFGFRVTVISDWGVRVDGPGVNGSYLFPQFSDPGLKFKVSSLEFYSALKPLSPPSLKHSPEALQHFQNPR